MPSPKPTADDQLTAQAILLWLDGVPQREISQRIWGTKTAATTSTAIREFILSHHPHPPVYGPTSIYAGLLRVWGADRLAVAREALDAWRRQFTRPRRRHGSRR